MPTVKDIVRKALSAPLEVSDDELEFLGRVNPDYEPLVRNVRRAEQLALVERHLAATNGHAPSAVEQLRAYLVLDEDQQRQVDLAAYDLRKQLAAQLRENVLKMIAAGGLPEDRVAEAFVWMQQRNAEILDEFRAGAIARLRRA